MFGASLLLACNRIFVVGYFGVRAREADRRAELALCVASAGSVAGSSVTRMAPVCGSDSQTQAGTVALPAWAACRARRSWPVCVCLNWPCCISGCGPSARVYCHL